MQKVSRLPSRILALLGLLLLFSGMLSLIATNIAHSLPPPTQSTRSSSSSMAAGWSSIEIGLIDLSASDTMSLLDPGWIEDGAVVANKALAGYSFDLSSNVPGIEFSPNHGQLYQGQSTDVSILLLTENRAYEITETADSFSVKVTKLDGLTAITTLPTRIVQNQSFAINLTISATPTVSQDSAPPDQTQTSVTTNLMRAPSILPAQAFGSGYDFFVEPQLNATTLDIAPREQERQLLDQGEADFTWIVTPNESGLQTLALPIMGIWVPKKGGNPFEFQIAAPVLHFNVESAALFPPSYLSSASPFFSWGQITVGELAMIVLGSLLNIPWLLETLRKKQNMSYAPHSASRAKSSVGTAKQKRKRRRHR